jgi:hypothetical protein
MVCEQGDTVIDWVAFTGWATAAGSLASAGALVAAAITLRSEGKRWRADRRREVEERQAAEQGLASFVSAVTEAHGTGTALVVAANDGEQPVFHVRVSSERGARLISRSDNRTLDDVIRRLDSQEQVSFTFETLPGEEEFSRPVIDYFDMEGRRWRRSGFGPPQRCLGWWDDDKISGDGKSVSKPLSQDYRDEV